MAEVIKVSDATELVPAGKYKHTKFPFENFNPIQSRLFEIYDGDSNVAIAASTSAGKTVCSEMYIAYELEKRGGKAIYVGPMKALASEKYQDWSDPQHYFSGYKTSVVTGDFRFTNKRIKEIDTSDIIVMTPEMLASRCRNNKGDKSGFLYQVGTVVFDESHLLTVPGRGDHIEVALMKLTEINPNLRVVLLSATMPNVDEICGWITKLTDRNTYYLESEYRPCPLSIHYETYFDGVTDYLEREREKANSAYAIVDYYSEDKFLVFAHTIDTGMMLLKKFRDHGIKAEFHYAELTHKERKDIEDRFKTDPKLRVIVATSTLAWGLNLPARRVIVAGVHRGPDIVPNYDIQQMIGRAGRPKYDPRGDAYILVPESSKKQWMAHLQKKQKIQSTLLEYVGTEASPHYKTLAFHIVSEIHKGTVKTKEGFHDWFKYSLAHYQDHHFDDGVVDRTIEMLEKCHAIRTEDGEYVCTSVGKIASMFYYSPFDVSDLKRNFHHLFNQKRENDDIAVSMAMGNIDSCRFGIVNKQVKEQMSAFAAKVMKMYGAAFFTPSAMKHGFAYYTLLKGQKDVKCMKSVQSGIFTDLERTMQVIESIDAMSSKWDKKDYFKVLKLRLQYGVEPELAQLVQIPNVGQVRAKRLVQSQINTVGDLAGYSASDLAKIMKCGIKMAEEALDGARLIQLKESME